MTGEGEVPVRSRSSRSGTGRTRQLEKLHGAGRSPWDADADGTETEILRGGPGVTASGASGGGSADVAATLPSARRTAGVRRTGGNPADVPRTGGRAAPTRRPGGKADGWSAFERPSAPGGDAFPASGGTRAHPAVRDPWSEPEESARPGAARTTHDPHEVTVQLDGISLQLDNMLRAAKDAPGGGESSDGPVFVDESGRRSRRFRRIGIAVGLVCAVYAVVIVATLLSGNSDAPWLPVEGPREEQPARHVDTSPLPAESAAQPSGRGSASPETTASAGAGTTASPDAGATAPGASADAEDPNASADPEPSATRATANPGTDPSPDPDPTPETTPGDADPSPTDGGGSTEEPTGDPTTAEPGTDSVANGPSDPTPVAQEPDTTASGPGPAPAPAAPSPEYIL